RRLNNLYTMITSGYSSMLSWGVPPHHHRQQTNKVKQPRSQQDTNKTKNKNKNKKHLKIKKKNVSFLQKSWQRNKYSIKKQTKCKSQNPRFIICLTSKPATMNCFGPYTKFLIIVKTGLVY